MSLVELFDSLTFNNLRGGENAINSGEEQNDQSSGGLLYIFGNVFNGSMNTFGYMGGISLWFFLLLLTVLTMGFTIYRITTVCKFHIMVKVILVLVVLFVPIPFKTLLILGTTYFLQNCKTLI